MKSDSERLDKLEKLLRSDSIGNGLALFPSVQRTTGVQRVCIQDMGDSEGSDFGDELTPLKLTLREAIDALEL